ncbi:hypothetical protein [Thauera linaloolentis]|uniref:Uncharacterized protein n=1 Tax=Thauera linaloolentis (strain DSM 12138 / JCM 21573 / CCUG 41526 / CIP 105981 / IAM 15112 / NBRC 102519 / 47Lol) TaxID=1123367 RepID=N6YDM3_THAL4|nr:hypothetical protein [Thauera linaloolentis]ENO89645.1 hypothetical protein C666_05015 [Thauera linaloolentis 47Lol = DSM 12138]MCM8567125.1 hypothetical protein [Thauera linaloolentis]
MSATQSKNGLIASLVLVALVAMVAAYFAPIWWVSLTAPNYPEDAFPDGIRIHFHFDGVHNGCTTPPKTSRLAAETMAEDMGEGTGRYNPILSEQTTLTGKATALDCVHEMNTINHYVGMYPIATGGPVETRLSKFFIGFFAVMLAGFAVRNRKARLGILGLGFGALAVWMIVDQFVLGRLAAHVDHYVKESATFFNEPERIAAWGSNVAMISKAAIFGLIAAMAVVVAGVAKFRSFELLLALIPALLPLFYLIEYSGWLWFFGHNLHPWGAFTVKPFMPTVFGEGKVAQFSTFSYPHWGYALLVVVFLCLMLALLLRRKQLREELPRGDARQG